MTKLTYATTNPAKLKMMRQFLLPLNIQIEGLPPNLPEVEEGERLPLLNARKKAMEYFALLNRPVFSCDSGLFFENLPDELQPGTNVRTINGTRMTDMQMIDYYCSLAKKYGKLYAQYRNAICLVLDENTLIEDDSQHLNGEKFIVSDTPHPKRFEGFPIDSLSQDIATGKYYFDLEQQRRGFSMENGFRHFFKKALNI